MTQTPHPDESVGPLERGFAVLRALAAAPGGRLRPSELTKGTGLARSTVDRVAATLAELGYLRAEGDGRDLVLAPAAARPGNAYLRGCGLPGLLAPLAEELSAQLDESVSLAVPDRESVRFILQIKRRRALSVSFRVGDALPAERCAPGAIFAHAWGDAQFAAWQARLDQDPGYEGFPALPTHRPEKESVASFRQRIARAARVGCAEDDQLIEKGLIALAVPVYDAAGDVAGALSVVSHTSRQTVASLRESALPTLLKTAKAMSMRLAESVSLAAPEDPGADPAADSGSAADPDLYPDPAAFAADPTAAAKEQLGPEYLQSLARGLSVLSVLGEGGTRGLTLSEAAAATGLPRATARRSLLTSVRQGYVATDGNRFRILPRVLELGYARLSQLTLGQLALPHLEQVARTVHESASMAVLDGDDVRYVARAAAGRIMSVDILIGTRFPAFATSMGRVLLADHSPARRARFLESARIRALTRHTVTDPAALLRILEGVAKDGYALVDQELEEGLRSMAVPVRDPSGAAVAAVNVSMHAARTSAAEARASVLPVLREAAAAIAADLALLSFTAH
ncbi:IclR family transcriptional regulator domain-containing protein [Actinospica sp.]|uniref:IclR family transcriptional regulator domain-containing protein n=1 Tax=Actinospica sp. TaxID=1872142 RepID=UPI002BDA0E21|nr:IclR family transcriptional regulator C-terminal domain-containing protein [Actinospica sp.]HWG23419.1 IclR family transcriptional regulator C-terminal domain-containing protein [Actinospica sp.]